MVYYDQDAGTAFLYDYRRSIIMRFGPLQAAKAKAACPEVDIPFHEAGYRQFVQVVRTRAMQGQVLFVWARRVGDCIEIE